MSMQGWSREAEPEPRTTGRTGGTANGTPPMFNCDTAEIQTEASLSLLPFALGKFFEEGADHVWCHPCSLIVDSDQHVCPCLFKSHRDERT